PGIQRPSGPGGRPLSDRAKRRLRIAAALLRHQGLTEAKLGPGFFEAVLGVVDKLSPDQRDKLRSHVDWVEAYESAELEAGRFGQPRVNQAEIQRLPKRR
ncbi:MAG TPA: hypothetical protein VF169_09970, partial [Albitalea sp.]|uniref:hypothetical protein n=1 Tax=Piscinibacter sp. TaxID=1903157 RepID=UPI002ED1735F